MPVKETNQRGVILVGNGSADPDAMSLFRDMETNKLFKQCYGCSRRIYEDEKELFIATDDVGIMCHACSEHYG